MAKKAKKKQKCALLYPSLSWLPAFFLGLCLGIFIHLIPGMDSIVKEAQEKQRGHLQEEKLKTYSKDKL